MIDSEVHIVKSWHEALNTGDVERLVALSHPDVEVGGPRATGRGSRLLWEWAGRANIRLGPQRIFHRTDVVVVEQEAEWHSAETGQVTGAQTVASVFIIRDDRIASILRYDDLGGALRAANLDESCEARSD